MKYNNRKISRILDNDSNESAFDRNISNET